MKYVVVVVRDSAADVYATPWFTSSAGMAIRSFVDEVNRESPDNMLFRHPEDFTLFSIGTYDDADAAFQAMPVQQLMRGSDAKK